MAELAATTGDLKAAFKAAMRKLAASVTIVSTGSHGHASGMTATAVTSLCTDPPALLVCVNRSASIHAALAVGRPFCVNVLGGAHAEMALAFGGKVEPQLRFELGEWRYDESGVPFLADASALVFCTVDLLLDYGTHSIVVGKVLGAADDPVSVPLIYGDGGFLSVAVPD